MITANCFAQYRPVKVDTSFLRLDIDKINDSLTVHLDSLQSHNLRINTALTGVVFEKQLTLAEKNINVGFTLTPTSLIFLNGTSIQSTQWSGSGTQIVVLSLDTRQYDNLLIKK